MATVLFVDDSRTVQELVYGLEDAGHKVEWATSPNDAVELARSRSFDVAIIDMRLDNSEVDGLRLADDLRRGTRATRIPFIAFSGLTEYAKAASAHGFARFLPKPVMVDELCRVLHDVVTLTVRPETKWLRTESDAFDIFQIRVDPNTVHAESASIAAAEPWTGQSHTAKTISLNAAGNVSPNAFEHFGAELFRELLPERVRSALLGYQLQCDLKKTRGRVLLAADERYRAIPFELIRCDPVSKARPGGHFIGGEGRFTVSRVAHPAGRAWTETTVDTPVRVLVVGPQHPADRALNLQHELHEISAAFQQLVSEWRVLGSGTGKETIAADKLATFDHISRAIETFKPHVLHVMGHGTPGRVRLDVGDWDRALIEMGTVRSKLQLVVFNCCFSEQPDQSMVGLGFALSRAGVPAVVSQLFEVDDDLACAFTARLYSGLAQGLAIDLAVQDARDQVVLAALERSKIVLPVLHVHEHLIRFAH